MEYINKKLEEFNKFLDSKKVAIIGMGVSNLPLLDYFYDKNAKVTVFDKNTPSDEIMEKINKYRYEVEIGEYNLSRLNGFDIVFRSPSVLPTREELVTAANKGAIITSEIEMVLKLAPCKIIGVTGTEGKTTTTSIIYEILKSSGKNCFLGGNIGKPIFTEIKNMKPEDIVVLELSSFQLMGMEVSPDISVVTNMYPDHLNIHSSYEEYQQAKKNIFLHQNENGVVILNYDNEITRKFADEVKSNLVYFSSLQKLKNGYVYDRKDETIKRYANGKSENILKKQEIKLRGIHNYENICAALAATASIVDEKSQIKAIKEFNGVEHRLEFVRELNGVKYYNDSIGTSPASTIAGLNAFDENIILLAGGSDKGLDYTEIGETIAKKVRVLLLTGPTAEKIENATKLAMNKAGKETVEIIHCKDLQEAVSTANEKAKSGEIVLMSPASASFDAFKNFIERGIKFKEFVNNL
jgi:UDP-N-acetylmuramoylalanine--D-glutamate ligase